MLDMKQGEIDAGFFGFRLAIVIGGGGLCLLVVMTRNIRPCNVSDPFVTAIY